MAKNYSRDSADLERNKHGLNYSPSVSEDEGIIAIEEQKAREGSNEIKYRTCSWRKVWILLLSD
jgi:hypothetical protein